MPLHIAEMALREEIEEVKRELKMSEQRTDHLRRKLTAKRKMLDVISEAVQK
jgi:hypothetical protein